MPAALSPSVSGLPCPPDAVDEFLSRPEPGAAAVVARTPGPFLVLGAGGKLGLHLCAMLRRALDAAGRSDPVIAVSRFRTLRDADAFTSRGVQVLAADLADEAALAALPDAPTVFFLAGIKFGTATAPGLLRAVNVEIPARVARRFAGSRLAAFSSGCVYPFVTPESGGADEGHPLGAVGDYAASCIAREEAFTRAAGPSTPVALLRLNYAVEFRYGVLLDLAQRIWRGEPVDVSTGHVNVIWQSDAVAHAIQALELAGHPAVPVNLTGPGTLRVRDLARQLAAELGREVTFTGHEAPTAWLNNAAASHRRFGAPRVTIGEMIRWTAAWVRSGGVTWGKPTGFERRDGRF